MQDNNNQLNKSAGSRGKIIAIVLICAVAIIAAFVIIFKNSVFYNLALREFMSEDYQNASKLVSMSDSQRARILEKYIFLKRDIGKKYTSMLLDFNENTFAQWNDLSCDILENSDVLSEKISEEAEMTCNDICAAYDSYMQYIEMRTDVKEMMKIFSLINQLYTKDDEGKNMAFTVKEINEKVDSWTRTCDRLEEISYNISGTESVYLLNYLISEFRGEREDISSIIDMIHDEGYGDKDTVRLSGSGSKSYTKISNGNGTTVVVSEPDEYESNMYAGICRAIIKNIGNDQ